MARTTRNPRKPPTTTTALLPVWVGVATESGASGRHSLLTH